MVPLCTLIVGACMTMQLSTPWSVSRVVYSNTTMQITHQVVSASAKIRDMSSHPRQSRTKSHLTKRSVVSHNIKQPASLKSIETMAALAPVLSSAEGTAASAHHLAVEKTYQCMLTAYGPGFESTGKHPGDPAYGITASGRIALPRHTVAVDPRLIPLGSLMYIDGIGYRVAEDVGGAIRGQHIDLYFPNDTDAVKFGVKSHVKVFVFAHPK